MWSYWLTSFNDYASIIYIRPIYLCFKQKKIYQEKLARPLCRIWYTVNWRAYEVTCRISRGTRQIKHCFVFLLAKLPAKNRYTSKNNFGEITRKAFIYFYNDSDVDIFEEQKNLNSCCTKYAILNGLFKDSLLQTSINILFSTFRVLIFVSFEIKTSLVI